MAKWLQVAFLCFLSGPCLAFQVGPKPSKLPGLIVKLRQDAVATSAAGQLLRPIDAANGLYHVEITDAATLDKRAAQLEQMAGVAYVVADEWVSIAITQAVPSRPPPKPRPPLPRPRPPPLKPKPRPPLPRTLLPQQLKPVPKLQPPQHVPPRPPRPRPPQPWPPRPRPPRPRPPRPRPPRSPSPPVAARRKPNDNFYSYQWGMPRINAEQAWALKVDSSAVRVCIVDTGVKYDHPDLTASLVPMPAEWQTKNTDDNGHGTHVAGIIGAVGNNKVGVTGVAWKASILACKALDSTGWGLVSKVIECIQWCRSRGAKVVNTSFELANENVPLKEAIGNSTKAGLFFAGAAGNTEGGKNNDVSNSYPAGYKFPGNVAVANLNSFNQIDDTSNFGPTTVQLAAPGTGILSTWIYREFASQYYTQLTGTSMAAPYVAGAAALAIAASQGILGNAQVADLMIKTSMPIPALQGKVVANGVINLQRLVAEAINMGQASRAAAAAKC